MPRRPDSIVRQAGAVFLVCLLGYVGFFYGLEGYRARRGPWEVTFTFDANGTPTLEVHQPRLQISTVQLSFPGQTVSTQLLPQTIRFDGPAKRTVPFGKVKFLDTTFLPGTVTLEVFGHEIELLPRVLIIDKQEHRWQSTNRHRLPAAAR